MASFQSAAAEPQFCVVFDGKEGKYEVLRTPQLLVTKAGTLLAFAQGRSGSHDRSDNDIILKRSADGGQTWSKFQVIADQGKDALNSICVVQLRDTGRILVIGCWFPDGYEMMQFQYLSPGLQEYHRKAGHDKNPAIRAGYDGRDIARNYLIQTDDDGQTWSPLRDITREVKRPAPDISRGELAPDGETGRARHGDETQFVELPGEDILLNARLRPDYGPGLYRHAGRLEAGALKS